MTPCSALRACPLNFHGALLKAEAASADPESIAGAVAGVPWLGEGCGVRRWEPLVYKTECSCREPPVCKRVVVY